MLTDISGWFWTNGGFLPHEELRSQATSHIGTSSPPAWKRTYKEQIYQLLLELHPFWFKMWSIFLTHLGHLQETFKAHQWLQLIGSAEVKQIQRRKLWGWTGKAQVWWLCSIQMSQLTIVRHHVGPWHWGSYMYLDEALHNAEVLESGAELTRGDTWCWMLC